MPKKSPFYERILPLCISHRWKTWAGYYAVCSFDTTHDREYFAFRHSAGVIDVSPLFKYDVRGPEAAEFLSYVMTKNIHKLKLGQVTYCGWCDEEGKLVDDGTVTRLGEHFFRVTSAEPTYAWFHRYLGRFQVEVEDCTAQIGALSVQGPNSKEILKNLCDSVESLKFFRAIQTQINGRDVVVSRTGYTGDLGYEIWVNASDAHSVWDALIAEGRPYGLEPAGLDSMDVTRVEAGFIMNGVDYFSANHCFIDSRKSTPYEVGLGWTVQLNRDPFVGKEKLLQEKECGSRYNFVGIDMDWDDFESVHASYGLPPQICTQAWRDGRPIYDSSGKFQIGYATSGAWSPLLKKNLAIAKILPQYSQVDQEISMEVTVEYTRRKVRAKIAKTPFFNPPRKRS